MVQFEEKMNAADYFMDRNLREGRGEHLAIVDAGDGREYSYREIAEMTDRFGNALINALDTRIEERVMLILLDSPAFAACFFGSIKVGAVPIPANTLLKPHEYLYLLNDSRARVLVISAPLLPQVSPIVGRLNFLQHLIIVDDPGSERLNLECSIHDYETLLRNSAPDLKSVDRHKDDTCFWLYSSGTTGFPKGTVHLQHDMLFCSETYAKQILQIKETDRTFSVAKLFFAYGLGNGLYFPFSVGAATILNPARPDPETVF
ncbi:AMP-binding protein, partial [bacterium]|nr:AMP-binding protein [bacterium]